MSFSSCDCLVHAGKIELLYFIDGVIEFAKDNDLAGFCRLRKTASQQNGRERRHVIAYLDLPWFGDFACHDYIGPGKLFQDQVQLGIVQVIGFLLDDQVMRLSYREAGDLDFSGDIQVDVSIRLHRDGLVEVGREPVLELQSVARPEEIARPLA